MKTFLTCFLFVAFTTSFAQEIYKPFAVEKEAIPKGGYALLEKFIQANQHMPYSAEVKKVKGTLYVSGVVEPDGSVSDVHVTRPLEPACDREAVRVVSLFKAWEPALKDGKPVRQEFTYSVKFSPTRTGAEPDKIVNFYDEHGNLVIDEQKAQFRQITLVDSLGYPIAGPSVYKRQDADWKLHQTDSLSVETRFVLGQKRPVADTIHLKLLAIKDKDSRYQGLQYSFYPDGALYSVELYEAGKSKGKTTCYYPNGLVRLQTDYNQAQPLEHRWYANGQVKQVATVTGDMPWETTIIDQWDSLGNQHVKLGEGMARTEFFNFRGWVIEEGKIKSGLQEGIWVGTVNGQLSYRDKYTKGKFVSGVSYGSDLDSVRYKRIAQLPEFSGGLKGMFNLIRRKIESSPDFAFKGMHGQVKVAFTVCTDGTLCNLKVVEGIRKDIDEAALQLVQETSGRWKPAVRRGRPTEVGFQIPISF
ncbi:energy transducer TonB [Tellurirhabdus bombi]|uniref:energy transducer TonB n=1 Tax=Tellurirhabdus bombi TaxID=2907205 RepID=UPI001F292C00|nr:energy transducer TonB [Tellurirhabdus bombi]